MSGPAGLHQVYVVSEDVVVREIQGTLFIIPIVAGVARQDEEVLSLNVTGRAVWDRLDGRRSLQAIVDELAAQFDAPAETIARDVLGLMEALVQRGMCVEAGGSPARGET